MKKFAAVTSIIGVVCMVLGVVVLTVATVAGGSFPRNLRRGVIHRYNSWDWDDGWDEDWEDFLEEGAEDCYFDGITELNARVGRGSCLIREEDTDRVRVRIYDSDGLSSCSQDGKQLKIDAGSRGKNGQAENGLGRFLRGEKPDRCQVEVTVPEGYRFDNVYVELGAGSLEADALRADTITLDAGAGYGEIDLLEAGNLTADVGVGYLEIGRADIKNMLEADCGVGSFQLCILGNREDFSYQVDCGMGTVTLDGESRSRQFKSPDGGSVFPAGTGEKQMRLSCGVGDIDISFEGQEET